MFIAGYIIFCFCHLSSCAAAWFNPKAPVCKRQFLRRNGAISELDQKPLEEIFEINDQPARFTFPRRYHHLQLAQNPSILKAEITRNKSQNTTKSKMDLFVGNSSKSERNTNQISKEIKRINKNKNNLRVIIPENINNTNFEKTCTENEPKQFDFKIYDKQKPNEMTEDVSQNMNENPLKSDMDKKTASKPSENQGNSGTSSENQNNSKTSAENQGNLGTTSENQSNSGTTSENQSNSGTTSENQSNSGTTSENQSNLGTSSENQSNSGTSSENQNNSKTSSENQSNSGTSAENQSNSDKITKDIEIKLHDLDTVLKKITASLTKKEDLILQREKGLRKRKFAIDENFKAIAAQEQVLKQKKEQLETLTKDNSEETKFKAKKQNLIDDLAALEEEKKILEENLNIIKNHNSDLNEQLEVIVIMKVKIEDEISNLEQQIEEAENTIFDLDNLKDDELIKKDNLSEERVKLEEFKKNLKAKTDELDDLIVKNEKLYEENVQKEKLLADLNTEIALKETERDQKLQDLEKETALIQQARSNGTLELVMDKNEIETLKLNQLIYDFQSPMLVFDIDCFLTTSDVLNEEASLYEKYLINLGITNIDIANMILQELDIKYIKIFLDKNGINLTVDDFIKNFDNNLAFEILKSLDINMAENLIQNYFKSVPVDHLNDHLFNLVDYKTLITKDPKLCDLIKTTTLQKFIFTNYPLKRINNILEACDLQSTFDVLMYTDQSKEKFCHIPENESFECFEAIISNLNRNDVIYFTRSTAAAEKAQQFGWTAVDCSSVDFVTTLSAKIDELTK
ncbi:pyrimidine 5'-nucleotidase [Pseudoloma neurophilia]|uniref:Pyrimidine 5'-nucleotidase n=1 Tax=Pseudoloma neurophilia TaxID=146866 RepID=A0A0R0MAP0_9MICR|nr:pyrimidine 5'-nucleotidase [Pseudoloma neurophilia]